MKKNRKKFRSLGRAAKILPCREYVWENGAVIRWRVTAGIVTGGRATERPGLCAAHDLLGKNASALRGDSEHLGKRTEKFGGYCQHQGQQGVRTSLPVIHFISLFDIHNMVLFFQLSCVFELDIKIKLVPGAGLEPAHL